MGEIRSSRSTRAASSRWPGRHPAGNGAPDPAGHRRGRRGVFLVDARAGLNAHDHEIAQLLRNPASSACCWRSTRPRAWAPAPPWPSSTNWAWASRMRFRRARRWHRRPDRAGAEGPGAAGRGRARRGRPARSPHQAGHRRTSQRRQVHAHQHADGRRARHRVRHAGHHARRHRNRLRARRPPLHADRHGLRKRGKVFEAVEKFSVIKTLQAIEASNVVLLMLDAQTEISEQDAHIAGFVLERAARWWSPSTNGMAWTPTRRNASSASSSASCASCPSPACTRFRRLRAQGMRPLLVHQRRPQRRLRQAVHARSPASCRPRSSSSRRPARASSAPRCATRTRGPEPAAGRHPRQRAGCGAGFLPALPGNAFPQRLRPGRHAAADRIQVIAQSLRAGRLTP